MNGFTQTLTQLLLGAGERVDVLASSALGFLHSYEDVAPLVDERLRRRCILTEPELFPDRSQQRADVDHALEMFHQLGWEIRLTSQVPTIGCVIADGRECLLSSLGATRRNGPESISYVTSQSPILHSINEHFEMLWSGSIRHSIKQSWPAAQVSEQQLRIGYEQLLISSIPARAEEIIVASNEFWDRRIRYFAEHPNELRSTDSRYFEELVAELLSRSGLDVELTPRVADSGRDVLAWADTVAGRHLYLVECKRYAEDRPVGVAIVRALYGVVQAEDATAGLIVTTSDFTKGARLFQETVKHRMGLRGYEGLIEWLKKTT